MKNRINTLNAAKVFNHNADDADPFLHLVRPPSNKSSLPADLSGRERQNGRQINTHAFMRAFPLGNTLRSGKHESLISPCRLSASRYIAIPYIIYLYYPSSL
jgi:hypothetical protein